jgi:hypothetical protein
VFTKWDGGHGVDDLAPDTDRRRAHVNVVMKLPGSIKCEEFLY